ncbi:UDP-N-acetylmuramate dehydrogenase [Alteribacter populi]|uniref:UDP-N-acetylmuramate dehydrogenase n=1 Tax=Alteribacter populi TaxID=2011011 RepID=UPI000BBA5040|nr:UDP-N-acetylmuramate dehydrogenase [Alteribacter populi]
MKALKEKLERLQDGEIKENEPLKNHTTWKIGGPASLFFVPGHVEALKKAVEFIKKSQVEWFVIGKGSNLLVSDEGFHGVIIKLTEELADIKLEGSRVRAGGGVSLIKLATLMSKEGFSGLEFAGGIPGTVGGAVFMNAGAHGSDISNIFIRAHILYPDGTFKWIDREEMAFSYRTTKLQSERGICIEAEFGLSKGDKEQVRATLQKNKDYRRQSQPWNYPCCGSVFRNPLPHYAGQLIEQSGLKGYSIGGAQISTMHANFIVNKGDATAKDVLKLINHIKDTISREYDIKMATEVEWVGEVQ